MYTGYILADFTIAGAGEGREPADPARFVDAGHGLGTYDQAGLACKPVDVSCGGRIGKAPATGCATW